MLNQEKKKKILNYGENPSKMTEYCKNVYIQEKLGDTLITKIRKKIKNKIKEIKSIKIKSIIILFYLLFHISSSELISIEFRSSNITLKIKGTGYRKVLGKKSDDSYYFDSNYYPNEIYINGEKQNNINYTYFFNQTDNFVLMVWYNNINNCKSMFHSCSDITEIDMSNFDSSQVTEMNSIFSECISLTSINLSNFVTSQNTNFGSLFYDCFLLTSLNLSTFNTSKATYMAKIFRGCSSLVSIDIKNFDTSQVENMNKMFYNCSSLTSLDLSNFDTSKVSDMNNMFYNCSSLSSLNLSNFNNQNVQDMTKMFYGCVHLEYINLKNFVLESYSTDSLYNTPENIVICINDQYSTFINNLNSACLKIDCSDDWKLNQKKIIDKNGTCIDSCSKDYAYKFEYNGKCYQNCKDGFLTDDNNITNKCKCELEQCLLCPPVALEINLCTMCNINYYPKENDPLNIGEYINCYRNREGYYLDKNDSVYKKCYSSCESCDKKGDILNHNCIKCKSNYDKYLINNNIENNYTNCYEKCDYYHFFDDRYNFHCTSNYSCPKEYPILVQSKKECIIYKSEIIKGIDNIKDFQEIINIINTKTNGTKFKGKDEKIEYYNTILQNIESIFTNVNYNTTNLENGKEDIIKIGEMAVTFTSTQNQKKNINDNKNKTAINLGECETLLKEYYKIPDNKELYIKMIEVYQ